MYADINEFIYVRDLIFGGLFFGAVLGMAKRFFFF